MSELLKWRRIDERAARELRDQDFVERVYLCAQSASGTSFVWQGEGRALAVLSPAGALYPQMPAALQLYGPAGALASLASFGELLPDLFVAYTPSTIALDGGAAYEQLTCSSQLRLVCRRGSLRPVARPDAAQIVRACTAQAEHDICSLYTPGESLFDPVFLERWPFFAAQLDGRCVGAVGAHIYAPKQGVALIGHLVVEPASRKLGLGGALLSAITQAAQRTCPLVLADVELDNAGSRRLLQSLGYEAAGEFTLTVWKRKRLCS